jgi:5-(aminomethyl)-3-furanmethanol phosphate kinase
MSGASRQLTLARPAKGWRGGVLRGQPQTVHLSLPVAGPLVLKVGGSLLSRPDWPSLIASLIAARGPSGCCLVVGGGAVVDGLRSLDNALPQSPQLMHDLAIDAMRLTARLVAAAVNVPIAASPPDDDGVAVLDVPAWLGIGSRATTLPVGWQVTSDAIAATVAVEHGGHLLLAKSVPPPPCPDNGDLLLAVARAGWVDDHFPVAAGKLITIEWAAPTGLRLAPSM